MLARVEFFDKTQSDAVAKEDFSHIRDDARGERRPGAKRSAQQEGAGVLEDNVSAMGPEAVWGQIPTTFEVLVRSLEFILSARVPPGGFQHSGDVVCLHV